METSEIAAQSGQPSCARFGRPLTMDMARCFFSEKYMGRGELFEGLCIWEEAQRALQQSKSLIGEMPAEAHIGKAVCGDGTKEKKDAPDRV